MKSEAIFDAMKQQIAGRKGLAKKINAVFAWEITQGGKKAAEWSTCLYHL